MRPCRNPRIPEIIDGQSYEEKVDFWYLVSWSSYKVSYNLTFSSYDCPFMISGTWYPGVPTRPHTTLPFHHMTVHLWFLVPCILEFLQGLIQPYIFIIWLSIYDFWCLVSWSSYKASYNLTFSSYDCPSMISGTWYPGVPTRPHTTFPYHHITVHLWFLVPC
jgi:hypothetical protein